jgi:hypothetical protein
MYSPLPLALNFHYHSTIAVCSDFVLLPPLFYGKILQNKLIQDYGGNF